MEHLQEVLVEVVAFHQVELVEVGGLKVGLEELDLQEDLEEEVANPYLVEVVAFPCLEVLVELQLEVELVFQGALEVQEEAATQLVEQEAFLRVEEVAFHLVALVAHRLEGAAYQLTT